MNYTYVTAIGDGVTTAFPFSFAGQDNGYLSVSNIHVFVAGLEVPFTVPSNDPNKVYLNSPPAVGAEILIRRIMPKNVPYSDFSRGNPFSQDTLNNTNLQQLYIVQELLDGYMPDGFYFKTDINMGGHKLVNLGEGTQNGDSVRYEQWKDTDDRLVSLETGFVDNVGQRSIPWYYVATGGETELSPPYTFQAGLVFINGIFQNQNLGAYSIINNIIKLAEPLFKGDEVYVLLGSRPAAPDDYATQEELQNAIAEFSKQTGASLIGISPMGRLSDAMSHLTPEMFGAKGDGVTDDTDAIQAALDYGTLHGMPLIFFGARTYLIMKPLIYKQKNFRNCRILCFGGRAVIKLNSKVKSGLAPDLDGSILDVNAAIVITPDNPDTAVRNQPQAVYIDGLQFTTDVGAEYAIYSGRTQNTNIMNILCTGFTKSDIRDTGSWVMRVRGCQLFSACEYNFYKSAGTSTHLEDNYMQNADYAIRLKCGYSSVTGNAADLTKKSAIWLESSDYNSVYSLDRNGFENSGADSVVKVSGRIALNWSNSMAGNIESQQSPAPTNLLWIQGDSNGSQFTLSNIRYLGITTRCIYDLGTNSRFTINRVNGASGDLPNTLGTGAIVVDNNYNNTKFSSAANPNGVTIGANGIADQYSNGKIGGGLPNDQVFLRYTKTITRQGTEAFGQITLTLPVNLDTTGEGYQVFVTPQVYPNNLATEKWFTSYYNRTANTVVISAGRGDGNTAWTSIPVSIMVIGARA